jgi:hypothetical protein
MLDRGNKLTIPNEEHTRELSIINTIATNDEYDMTLIKVYNKHKNKCNRVQDTQNNDKKMWANFTYFGDEIRTPTKHFKKSPIRICYYTNNTIKNNCIIPTRKDKYDTCGVYKLKCLTWEQVYVGQKSRGFKTRYKELIKVKVEVK